MNKKKPKSDPKLNALKAFSMKKQLQMPQFETLIKPKPLPKK